MTTTTPGQHDRSATPLAVIDALSSLLEAELNSIFRFMGEGSPYLSRATVEVRRPLQEMVLAEKRRARELADLIDSLGSVPTPVVGIRRDEQYLAFLSLKFLLPKLVGEKRLHIERYENAVKGLQQAKASREVESLLQSHLTEMRSELSALEAAAAHVAGPSKPAAKDPSAPASGGKSGSDAGPHAG
jgi:hypothetical protein